MYPVFTSLLSFAYYVTPVTGINHIITCFSAVNNFYLNLSPKFISHFSVMSSFAPPSKKSRRSRSNGAAVDSEEEFFPGLRANEFKVMLTFLQGVFVPCCLVSSLVGIKKIEYKPDAGPGDNLCYKHYKAKEVNKLYYIKYLD